MAQSARATTAPPTAASVLTSLEVVQGGPLFYIGYGRPETARDSENIQTTVLPKRKVQARAGSFRPYTSAPLSALSAAFGAFLKSMTSLSHFFHLASAPTWQRRARERLHDRYSRSIGV
jgi:hypothetical protein